MNSLTPRSDRDVSAAARKRPGIVEFLRAPSEAPNWVVFMLSVYMIRFAWGRWRDALREIAEHDYLDGDECRRIAKEALE